MKRLIRPFLLLFALTGFSLQGFAFNPKLKPRIRDGVSEGSGSGACAPGTEEAKLPIGLPFQLTDASTPASGEEVVKKGNLSQIVYTFDLVDGQGPESVHSTHNAFEQARSMNAACVLIRMNSFDGALNAAENLSQEMVDYDRPVMVYVDNKAIPMSTIISMANEKSKKSAKVKHTPRPAKTSSAKKKSAAAPAAPKTTQDDSEEHAAAEANLAASNESGTLNAQAENLDQALAHAGLNNYQVVHYTPGLFAKMIDWCMQPFVSLSLIVVLALGLRLQITSAFPGPATFLLMVSLPLLAVPLYMGGLAGAPELTAIFALAVTAIILGKKNARNVYRAICALLLIAALAFAQQGGSGTFNLQELLPVLLLSSIAFSAGWFVTAFFRKIPPSARRRVELVPAT